MRRFSAFDFSAAAVKLKEPVINTCPSIIMILLCAIACFESIHVGTLALRRNVADEYLAVCCPLSRITRTLTPRLYASAIALAIGADVKLYAWASIDFFAAFNSAMIADVQPPEGEK